MGKEEFIYQLGVSIRKYRCIAGLSQEGLSAVTECDKNTIGKIERGETDPRLSTLSKIAGGLGVPFSILSKEAERDVPNALAATIEYDFLRLFEYCHHLSPEQFNNLCNTAHIFAKGNERQQVK